MNGRDAAGYKFYLREDNLLLILSSSASDKRQVYDRRQGGFPDGKMV